MTNHKEDSIFRVFFISASMTIVLCLSAVFLGLAIRSRDLINEEMLARARAQFSGIIVTREWNAKHGGVYVLKTPGMLSNPYLKNPDISDTAGNVYTKKNPALMTREISELASKGGQYVFHITSLKPINPHNAPDSFETEALNGFTRGIPEAFAKTEKAGRTMFRYMAPLMTEEPCLACHRDQGYKVGDVRGGISVSFDVDMVEHKLDTNLKVILTLSLLTLAALISLFTYFFRQMKKRLMIAREELRIMAATDPLTGALNRRTLLGRFKAELDRCIRQRCDIGCILIDLDHFKRINDTYGHQAGDEVLRKFAALVKNHIRPYDVFGRYGGEEFMLVLPESGQSETVQFAERIRDLIETELAPNLDFKPDKPITASLGAATAKPDETVDTVLKRADEALYLAKENGRNRVESH